MTPAEFTHGPTRDPEAQDRATIAALRTALAPFAAYAELCDRIGCPDAHGVLFWLPDQRITARDFRQARDTLLGSSARPVGLTPCSAEQIAPQGSDLGSEPLADGADLFGGGR